jgi:rhomboid protease GluP
MLGNALEGRWGWKRFIVLYIGSGLIGGVAVLLVQKNPIQGTVGASGAISGLLTSLAVWAWMHRRYLPPQFVEGHSRVVGISLVFLIASGFLPHISMSAHVGGAIGGAVLSVPLAWMTPHAPWRHRIMGVVCLGLIAILCVLLLMTVPHAEPLPRAIVIDRA